MIKFKPLELEDRSIFSKYLGDYCFKTYEYSFLTLYLWRKMFKTEYGILDDALIIKKSNKSTGSYFMQPIGYKKRDIESIVLKLNDIRKSNPDFKSLFRDIEAPFLEEFGRCFGGNISVSEDLNNFDYVYNCRQLAALSGSKFHRKKNQYNQFVNRYDYRIKDIHDETVSGDCAAFIEKWYENKEDSGDQLKHEYEAVSNLLGKITQLDIKGMAVYIDNCLAGFTIGEKAGRDMAIIHVEKGDVAYSGIYPFIIKTFADKYLNDVNFINRQEDMGIEGLRKAKMAYNPVRLEKKYVVDLL